MGKKKNSRRFINRILRYFKLILTITSLYYILGYLYIVSQRIFYPFELEWMEGGMLNQAQRILKGFPIYTEPTIDFVPYLYHPLFYYISALFMKITGVEFWVMRMISVVSSLGSGYLIFKIVERESKRRFYGFMAAGLFFSTYRVTGAWFDIARVDSLFLFLILSSMYALRYLKSSWAVYLCSILLSMTFFTKQSGIFFILSVAIYLLFADRIKFLIFSLLAIFLNGGIMFFLNQKTDGWYYYYTFILPKYQYFSKSRTISFFLDDLARNLPFILCYLAGFLFFVLWRRKGLNNLWLLILFSGAAFVNSLFARIVPGGYDNNLIPIFSFLIILFCIILSKFDDDSKVIFRSVVYASILFQFIIFRYEISTQIPKREDWQAGRRFMEKVSQIEGDLLILDHGFYAAIAGKRTSVHSYALGDLQNDEKRNLIGEVISALYKRISERYYEAIILDQPGNPQIEELVSRYYYKAEEVLSPNTDTFYTLTGRKTRPNYIYLPKVE
ncbi:glycosyltransferase family 39 protein [bacterium]|nr:glycosyltransferase family 39 protein [bacterium]MBU1598724.1 glycosyltransferase family 39 protein [bacterium]MBU2461696.1 glycosyltransferase family 39 protein [bacterium]